MAISKSVLYIINIIAIIVALPFLLFIGLFFISNIIDLQFGSDFFSEGLLLIPFLIPIISLIVLIKTKEESENYGKIASILFLLNSIFLLLGIIGIIYFTINPLRM